MQENCLGLKNFMMLEQPCLVHELPMDFARVHLKRCLGALGGGAFRGQVVVVNSFGTRLGTN